MWRSTGSGYPTAPADGPACGKAHQAQREALALPVELRGWGWGWGRWAARNRLDGLVRLSRGSAGRRLVALRAWLHSNFKLPSCVCQRQTAKARLARRGERQGSNPESRDAKRRKLPTALLARRADAWASIFQHILVLVPARSAARAEARPWKQRQPFFSEQAWPALLLRRASSSSWARRWGPGRAPAG